MTYTIHDQSEETMCDWCGRPLYAGDIVYTDASEAQVFCSPQDQRAWHREARDHWANAEYLQPVLRMSGAILDEIL